ncbi:MAG TPA: hypothetical protein VF545_12850 [Thermoleophilaceae bacterium]|jgi:predicted anti-sigma-YlaC factor YlaD
MQAPLAAVLAQFPSVPDPGQGSGGLRGLLNAFYVLLAVGFLVALVGHVIKARTMIITGLVMIFAGTIAFLVAVGSSG